MKTMAMGHLKFQISGFHSGTHNYQNKMMTKLCLIPFKVRKQLNFTIILKCAVCLQIVQHSQNYSFQAVH